MNGPKQKDNGSVVSLEQALKKPEVLVKDIDFEIKAFTLTLTTKTSFKRSVFIGNSVKAVNHFYQSVVQNLKIWIPPAPKVRAELPEVSSTDALTIRVGEAAELIESQED